MKRRARFLIAIALGGIAACAGSNALEQRVAALEQRLNQLETEDAGTTVVESVEAGVVTRDWGKTSDAHRLSWRPTHDAGWDTGSTGPSMIIMGDLPNPPLDRCLEWARSVCLGTAARAASGDAGDKLVWQRELKTLKPEDNAPGRACLVTENAKCKNDPIHYHRGAKLKRWLDQQLTPNRIDKAASSELARALQQHAGDSGTFEVLCVAEFCRVSGGDDDRFRGNLPNHMIGYSGLQILRFGASDPMYVARNSWLFPYSRY